MKRVKISSCRRGVCILFLCFWYMTVVGMITVYAAPSTSSTSSGTSSASTFSPVDVMASVTLAPNGEILLICEEANDSLSTYQTILDCQVNPTTSDCTVTFDSKSYSQLESDEKRKFMEHALSAITKSSMSAKQKNKFYSFVANQDTAVTNALKYLQTDANADFVSAKKYFDPWSGVLGTILGVLSVAIFMFSSLSMVFDVSYLTIPGVQAILERGEDNVKPFGVSKEAYTSKQDAERDTEYKNVLAIYMKRRVGLIFAMSICVGYLISGKIYDIAIMFIDAFTL